MTPQAESELHGVALTMYDGCCAIGCDVTVMVVDRLGEVDVLKRIKILGQNGDGL